MSERPDPGVFLERRSYRRRRMLDGLKVLPLMAAWLFMLPVFWPDGGVHEEAPKTMSAALIYVFGTWCAMIILGRILINAYRRMAPTEDPIALQEDRK